MLDLLEKNCQPYGEDLTIDNIITCHRDFAKVTLVHHLCGKISFNLDELDILFKMKRKIECTFNKIFDFLLQEAISKMCQ